MMPEETKNTSTEALKFEVVEHEPFIPDGSIKLCDGHVFIRNYVEPIFADTFADYYGAKFELTNTNNLMIALYFDRRDHDKDAVVATTRNPGSTDDGIKNRAIIETRQYTLRNRFADRWYLTEDGMNFMENIFMPNAINKRNGKVNYGNVITTVDMSNQYAFNVGQGYQLTKVSFIDPSKIAAEVFGRKDDEGTYIYKVSVNRVIGGPYATSSDFSLRIDRLNMNNYNKYCADHGISNNNGIVRRH